MRFTIILLLVVLGGILMNCSMSSPLTGGVTKEIPGENETFASPEPLQIESASVSARVFVRPAS